jgi:hypothetical protein
MPERERTPPKTKAPSDPAGPVGHRCGARSAQAKTSGPLVWERFGFGLENARAHDDTIAAMRGGVNSGAVCRI